MRGRQWWPISILVPIVAVAATARGWRLTHRELEHFDEGAYTVFARRIVEGDLGNESDPPYDPRYAPPLFPVAVAGAFLLFGVSAPSAIAVSAALGTAGVVALYLLIREVWGETAGLAAAVFLATCEYHLIYSRMALTETTFVFWALMALWMYVRAIRLDRLRTYAFAGALTGLAQNTKYHGIGVLVLVAVYLSARWLAALPQKEGRPPIRRQATGLALAFAVTAVLYAPWAVLIEVKVGHATMAAHTRDFVSFGRTSLAVLAGFATTFMAPSVLVLAAVGAAMGLVSRRPQSGLVILALAATALAPTAYTAYPRLLLPAAALACGVGGVGLGWLVGLVGPVGIKRLLGLRRGLAMALAGAIGARALARAVPILEAPPAAYARVAAEVEALHLDAPVFTDVQYCMRFYLHRTVTPIKTAEDVQRLLEPQPYVRYLVVDLRALRHPPGTGFDAHLRALHGEGHVQRALRNPLSDVTLLNNVSPSGLDRLRETAAAGVVPAELLLVIYRIPADWTPLAARRT